MEALPKDRPSVRSFERIETKIDGKLEELCVACEAVTSYFIRMGGDPLADSSFENYCDIATNITGEIEILIEGYHDVIKSKGLLQPVATPVSQTELVNAIKTLAESTGKHVTAPRSKLLRPYIIIRFP